MARGLLRRVPENETMNSARTTLSTIVVGLALASGCDSPEKAQATADQARQEAADQATKAQRDTDQARMQGEAIAQQKQMQANLTLTSAKDDYRARIASLLADLDKKMSDIRADNVTASPGAKIKNDASILTLGAKKDLLNSDLKQVDPATASSWDALKLQVDKDTSEARAMLSPLAAKN